MRLLRLFHAYLRLGLQNELQYRANFFVQSFTSILELGGALMELHVIFTQTDSLGGWRPAELRALVGVFFIVGGAINMLIAPSMRRLMEDVRLGTLDFALTKPEDAQALVSVRQFEVWKITDVILGFGVLIQALVQLGALMHPLRLCLFAGMLLAGMTVVYCFWLMLATCTFWFVRMDNILFIFQSMYDAGRWPLTIYPTWLRLLLTFLVPVAFAVTVPASALVGNLTLNMALGSIALAVFMLVLSRWFWKVGIRHYSGASA
ncbi:MAG TPA: ABC-2 family transporter protein [Planctomycetota bacterium]|nr:ABC-2 family transporter protein [Planctomycetota bacterium]